MKYKEEDLIGKEFNEWTVISILNKIVGSDNRSVRFALCKCSCGTIKEVRLLRLLNNKSNKCRGCINRDFKFKHGKRETPEYKIWVNMKYRCYNTSNKSYKDYGGRGIKVCDRWKDSFENFLEDMRERPSKDHSLDRIDNDGDYTPENCRWTDWKTQARNRRCNYLVTYNGVKKSLVEWCEKFNINYSTAHSRLERGWDIPKIFTTPTKTPFISS